MARLKSLYLLISAVSVCCSVFSCTHLYFVGPPHCIRRIRPTKKCEARKSVHEIVVNHHFLKWPHHNAYEFYHKIDWGGLTKKCDENCAHCTRPSTLRSSNSTHEIVAARKIGQQNSGQSSSLKWPHRNAYEFYRKIVGNHQFWSHNITIELNSTTK